jgi:hypothetical protein
VRRSLPSHPQITLPALPQVQYRARMLQRRSRPAAGGRGLCRELASRDARSALPGAAKRRATPATAAPAKRFPLRRAAPAPLRRSRRCRCGEESS